MWSDCFRVVRCNLERQIFKLHIVHRENKLILLGRIGDTELENLAAYQANEGDGPQGSVIQVLLFDHIVIIVAGDACEASHSVVRHNQVHWYLTDQKWESHLSHLISCHI